RTWGSPGPRRRRRSTATASSPPGSRRSASRPASAWESRAAPRSRRSRWSRRPFRSRRSTAPTTRATRSTSSRARSRWGPASARRRQLVPKGHVVEAWIDRHDGNAVWIGDETKALLDDTGGSLKIDLSLPADRVAVYYGPTLCDLESIPPEESLKGRVLSAHGI